MTCCARQIASRACSSTIAACEPGNRVMLRSPNTPMLAACWFAVLKAGGIAVTTMPLYRANELRFMMEKARSITRCATRACATSSSARARSRRP